MGKWEVGEWGEGRRETGKLAERAEMMPNPVKGSISLMQ